MKRAYLDDPRIVDTIQAVVEHDGEERTLQVPVFDLKYLSAGHCSAYVRMAAEKLFGKHYSYPCPTWQRKSKDKLIALIENDRELRSFVDEGFLVPGMGISFYNPHNLNNMKMDKEGYVTYPTHFTLFLGRSTLDRDMVVAHQYGKQTSVETIGNFRRDMLKRALVAKEVVDSWN